MNPKPSLARPERRASTPSTPRKRHQAVAAAEARQRERIARRLHDEVGQLQVLERLKLEQLRGLVGGQAATLVQELAALMAQATAASRAVVCELAEPANPGGLLAALEALARRISGYGQLAVTHEGHLPALALPEDRLAAVCRAVQELCLNAQKHAGARRVRIRSGQRGAWLIVSVCDDGIGLQGCRPWAPAGGFGLASVRAELRAAGGELRLRSVPGQGLRACILLPLRRRG